MLEPSPKIDVEDREASFNAGQVGVAAMRSGQDQTAGQNGQLKSGALSLPNVIVQAVAAVGPALAVLLTFQGAIQLAGVHAPLVYLIDCIPVLLMGATLAQLARAFPSAGGYYTYASRTIHPLAGFFTGWMYVLYSGLAPGIMFAFFARICQTALSPYGLELPWQATFVLTVGVNRSSPLPRRGAVRARRADRRRDRDDHRRRLFALGLLAPP